MEEGILPQHIDAINSILSFLDDLSLSKQFQGRLSPALEFYIHPLV